MGKIGNFAKKQAKKAVKKQINKYSEKATDYVILEKTFKVLPKEKLIAQIDQKSGLVITPVYSDDVIKYVVNDPGEKLRYLVKIKPKNSGKDIYLINAKGEDCAVIRKKIFSLKPTFLVRAGNQTLGVIKRGRKAPKPSFRAKYLGWKAKGNFAGSIYKVMENRKQVLTISRDQNLGLVLDFAEVSNSNELSGVILALVIDMVYINDLQRV